MRGAEQIIKSGLSGKGIIPACAGSSDHLLRLYSNGRDHPRVCGEQRRLTDRVSHLRGSSPRVRGAVPVRLRGVAGPGIIPACAGSSWCKTAICKTSSGSSPRVRGAVKKVNSNIRFDGIIPACAGSRYKPRFYYRGYRDHPRVCGEQLNPLVDQCFWRGSSPRVRGAD